MRKVLMAGALAAGLAGCGTIDAVYLENPETGQVVQCGPYETSSLRLSSAPRAETRLAEQRGCIADYQAQGFNRVPRP